MSAWAVLKNIPRAVDEAEAWFKLVFGDTKGMGPYKLRAALAILAILAKDSATLIEKMKPHIIGLIEVLVEAKNKLNEWRLDVFGDDDEEKPTPP